MKYHPHLRTVYGFTWYSGEVSQEKNIMEELSTDPEIQNHSGDDTCLFIHVMGYVIIRLYELHCRGQKRRNFKSTNTPFSLCHGTTLIFTHFSLHLSLY